MKKSVKTVQDINAWEIRGYLKLVRDRISRIKQLNLIQMEKYSVNEIGNELDSFEQFFQEE